MTQVTNPYLQINESNLIDNSITEFEHIEYLPRYSNNMNKDGQHIFETKDEDVFLLPHKAFLEIRGKRGKTEGKVGYAVLKTAFLRDQSWLPSYLTSIRTIFLS